MAHIIYCPKCSQYHIDGVKCIPPMTPEQEKKWFTNQLKALQRFEKKSHEVRRLVK